MSDARTFRNLSHRQIADSVLSALGAVVTRRRIENEGELGSPELPERIPDLMVSFRHSMNEMSGAERAYHRRITDVIRAVLPDDGRDIDPHESGDPRCEDVLFACGYYGDLRVGELLRLYGGDSLIIVQSVIKYRDLGYILAEEAKSGDLDLFLAAAALLAESDGDTKIKNNHILTFLAKNEDLGWNLRLRLTAAGRLAARQQETDRS